MKRQVYLKLNMSISSHILNEKKEEKKEKVIFDITLFPVDI
jgi:hypothetical protein